jgi:Zn-dependent protease with chaperone function
VTERPNVVLGFLLTGAAVLGALIVVGLVQMGGDGVLGLAAILVGALSACVFFLGELERVPVPALLIVSLALASCAALARALLRVVGERRLIARLPVEPVVNGTLGDVAAAAAVPVQLITSARATAFCVGLIRPRIVVSRALVERLADEELAAAVWHEAQHLHARAPAKSLVARLMARTFFWAPALPRLLDRYLLVKELEADRVAIAHTSRKALAGAVMMETLGQPAPASTVGLGESAAIRVDRLLDPGAQLPPLLTRTQALVTLTAVGALTFFAATPVPLDQSGMGHLHAMLMTMSLHGLPGMLAGLAVNASLFTLATALVRGVRRKRSCRH